MIMCWLCWLKLTLSRVIDADCHWCQKSWVRLIMIASCVDCVDLDWSWLAHKLTLLNEIDGNMLSFRLRLMELILIAHVSTLSTVIDPDWLICRVCRLKLTQTCSDVDSVKNNWPRLAHVLTLSTVIDPDWLMCRHCWPKLTQICSSFDLSN